MGGSKPRSRRLFVTTNTLDTLMAAAASIGLSSTPTNGNSTPAARGISATL